MTVPTAPIWSIARSREEFGDPDLPLLTVISRVGVRQRDLAEGRAPSEDLSGYRVVRRGDLVVNKLWARFGAYGVSDEDGVISPAYWVLCLDTRDVLPRFLHHVLQSAHYRAEIWRRSKDLPPNGFDLSWGQFRTMHVPVPPRATQRTIADFLDRECARIDELRGELEGFLAVLVEQKQVVITEAVNGEGPAVAGGGVGWVTTRLKDLVTVPLSAGLNEEAADGELGWPRYIRTTDVRGARELSEEVVRVRPDLLKTAGVERDDILLTRTGSIGTLYRHVSDEPCCYAGYLVRVRPDTAKVSPAFVEYALRSSSVQDQMRVGAIRSTIDNFNATKMGELRLRHPGREESVAVGDRLDRECARIDELSGPVKELMQSLTEYRDAVITEAVTGKLDVTDVSEARMSDNLAAVREGATPEVLS